jgi:peptidyl-prolyl cis-trans isomerase SurA
MSRAPLTLVALALALGIARGAASQGELASARPVDRIAAIVGSKPILASQVEEQLVLAQAQGLKPSSDSAGRAAMRHQVLTQMVDEELLVQQAERDTTIKVTDQEVQDQVEQTVQNVRKQFTSVTEFHAQLRAAQFVSEEEWRRWLADNQRRTILQQRLIEQLRQKGKLRPITPTEAQMREFWAANRAQQQKRPAAISFRQIVISPQADSAAKARARQLAESLAVVLRRGANFADVAKKFSSDSGSREQGGELGWFRRGVMVKQFEDVAFRLRPGEISDPVETEFGYHVIQVERVQPAEVLARHVLIAPEISATQIALARHSADSVHDALAHGAAFDTLGRIYADPQEEKVVPALPLTQLPPDYQRAIGADTVLGLKPVFEVGADTKRPKFVVFELTARLPEGELTLDEVKDRIRESLSQQLAVQHYLDLLRRTTYVDIRL